MNVFTVFLLFVASLFCSGCDGKSDTPPDSGLPVATVSVLASPGATPVHVEAEVATTVEERQTGLMNRDSMSENRGMLFVFRLDTTGGFWMKNTRIPLTIAYIGADGRVQELRTGVPYDDKNILVPAQPYRYVLEVNQGWFERHGVGVGSIVEIPPGLPEPE